MSNMFWQENLILTLSSLNEDDRRLRIAVVGVGQELRGDDAVGVYIARALMPLADVERNLIVIDAGSTPENIAGLLKHFHPDIVLIFDAVQMNKNPGSVSWLSRDEITSASITTHTLPLSIFADFVRVELDCEVEIIGIQPLRTLLGSKMTEEMYRSIDSIVRVLNKVFVEFKVCQEPGDITPQLLGPIEERR